MFASPWKDAVIVLVIVLLFFGPKRLPALSRSIGESIKEFKGGIAQSSESDTQSEIGSTVTDAQATTTGVTSEHTNA
jgi:sec-independent protein translocase protein TatA